ncbi:hypothetical protein GLOTRDRAFT_91313 [Gloeophyllum trabeum ATCC 11539]|uniref:Uncharacterized protein n=1 Tax=Gloeophyllum trabeum (strain ATCC 11539 / FP-39264 / Madison 617) TaxID=670483 RepID=S7S237_GLOTA|nr:uncharacterized protein GLOTRDRAFT_91313 [Gloeophyllum trabeum ATCC 11539]EPQ59844.1 hypothetical protein GLOTRDRAFT_91313 [Gloeophyllum trabeum ATCC 11539]
MHWTGTGLIFVSSWTVHHGHFSPIPGGINPDDSVPVAQGPIYRGQNHDLLQPRTTLEEEVAQIVHADLSGWMNLADPLHEPRRDLRQLPRALDPHCHPRHSIPSLKPIPRHRDRGRGSTGRVDGGRTGGWMPAPTHVRGVAGPSRRHRRLRYLAGVSRRVHVGLCSRRESVDAARNEDNDATDTDMIPTCGYPSRRVGCEYLAITAAGSVGLLVSSVRGEAGGGERSLEAGRVHAYVLDARRRAVNGGTRRLESCNGRRGGVWWIESITGGGRRRDRGDCLAHEIRARAGRERVCCLAFGVPSLFTTFTASYADPCPYPDYRAAPLCAPGPPAPNGERLSSSLGTTTAPCRCTSSLSSMPHRPQVPRVSFGDYVFLTASLSGIPPGGLRPVPLQHVRAHRLRGGLQAVVDDLSGVPAAMWRS